jgi:hypothetical protein
VRYCVLQLLIVMSFGDPIQEVERTKARVCGRSLVRIASSNPAGVMNACLLRMLYVVRSRCRRWADLSSRGVLPVVVCHCV